jgi:hypothetical protein
MGDLTMPSIRDSLRQEMHTHLRAMMSHALGTGIPVPSWVAETLARLEAEEASEAHEVTLSEIGRAHAELSRAIEPATPELMCLLYKGTDQIRLKESFGQVRIVRSFMVIAAASVALFVLVNLSEYANDPAYASFFTSSGYPLFVNEVVYIVAASMGAAFSNLFQVSRSITRGTFSPSRESSYWVQYILGIVAGFLMGTILNITTIAPKGNAAHASLNFSGVLLAIMGGFSANLVQKIIQRMIDALESIVRGSADQEIEAREQANKFKTEESLAKARLRTTKLLSEIQRRLAAGESPESLGALLDQASKSVLTNTDQPLPPPALPAPPVPSVENAALEVRAMIEAEGGAPLAGASYEIRREGKVVASGQTSEKGEVAQPVEASGDYEIVVFGEAAAEAPTPQRAESAESAGPTRPAALQPSSGAPRPSDAASKHTLAAWHAARLEIARGHELHGAGKIWETAGSNRGPLVDQYIQAFTKPATAPPWCGMFVGYNYLKAGFKTAGQIPASQTTDGRPVPRKTMFMSAVRLMLYLKGSDRPRIEFPTKKAAAQFTTRDACAAWLDQHLKAFAPQPGDILLCHTSSGDYTHVGMVASYDPATYALVTYEGNYGNRAGSWRWDLADPSDLGFFRVNMIGRLAPEDFEELCEVPPEGPSPDPIVEKGNAASAR